MKKVYLSPSVQEKNVGVGNYGTEEYRCNQICDLIMNILSNYDLKVYRNKINMDLKTIVQQSNSVSPDLHLAIHTNAFNGKIRGCEVFSKKNASSNLIANKVYKNISAITPINDRGVKDGSHLYEISKINTNSILIEIAFHDNPDDAEWIINNIENIAYAITDAIIEFLNIPKKKHDDKTLYRVMVGSYHNINNAKKHIDELKKKKMDAVIMPYKK